MGKTSRKPAVAGMFYPGTENGINSLLSSIYNTLKTERRIDPAEILGVVVPHAGHIYSGKTAMAAYKYIGGATSERFVLIGPNHEGYPPYSALYPEGEWITPLGPVPIDKEICDSLLSVNKRLYSNADAHSLEHSLEVQVPILQFLLGNKFSICPVIMGNQEMEEAMELAKSLTQINQRFILVASSDLTHYESLEMANKKDSMLLDAVVSLDVEAFYSTLGRNRITSCGYGAIATLMEYTRMKDGKIELIDYSTSFDRTGDASSVVGYASLIAYRQH